MLDPEAGAGAAVVARRPAAVLQTVFGQGLLPVLPQEVPVQPGRDVVPGQDLVLGAVPVDGVVEGQAGPLQGVGPQAQVEMLGPLLEGPALAPDRLDDRPHPAVAPAHESFDRGGLGVVPAQGQAPGAAGGVLQQMTLRRSSSMVFCPNHWNGVCALGTNPPTEAVTVTLRW